MSAGKQELLYSALWGNSRTYLETMIYVLDAALEIAQVRQINFIENIALKMVAKKVNNYTHAYETNYSY